MIIFISAFIFVFVIVWLICWCIHISMNKEEKCPYGYADFPKFYNQFYKYDKWKIQDHWKGSFFGSHADYSLYYIHAGIIKFDGKCMILDPVSWLIFVFWKTNKWNKMYAELFPGGKIIKQIVKW